MIFPFFSSFGSLSLVSPGCCQGPIILFFVWGGGGDGDKGLLLRFTKTFSVLARASNLFEYSQSLFVLFVD